MAGSSSYLAPDAADPLPTRVHPSHRLVPAAVAWILGLILGHGGGGAKVWIILALVPTLLLLVMLVARWWRGVIALGLLALVFWGGAWMSLRERYVSADWIGRYIGESAQLAIVTGTVEGPAVYAPPHRGAMAAFNTWEPPSTQCVLHVTAIEVQGRNQPAQGRLLLRLRQADDSLKHGTIIVATGWLSRFETAANPGTDDPRQRMRRLGMDGRLVLENKGNYQVLVPPSPVTWQGLRQQWTDRAADSLELGLQQDPTRRALLEALLLGRWSADLEEIRESFRRTGLMHLLAISGAHLAVLMGLAWLVIRPWVAQPSRTALLVLAVLLLYLMMLPMQVAIARSGLMAGLLCLGVTMGRRVSSLDMLALAAVILLIVDPQEILSPGFQLSFAVTAGLLLFVRPLEQRMLDRWSMSAYQGLQSPGGVVRWTVRVLAVAIVGFVISLPLVAHHFQVVSPLAIPISLLAGPVVAMAIGLGFFKILAGWVLPSSGMLLAWPLERAADGMMLLTQWGAKLPGAAVRLDHPPSWGWTLGVMLLGVAYLAGWFTGHRRWLWVAVMAAVLTANLWPWTAGSPPGSPPGSSIAFEGLTRLQLHTLAVGDGNCHLLRIADARGREEKTLMFDCGSAGRTDIALHQIIPTLGALGVRQIDLLMLSHVDMDHINGTLDLADAVTVKQVAINPQFQAIAQRDPHGPAGFLLRGLQTRNVPVQLLAKGWTADWFGAKLDILWPPPEPPESPPPDTPEPEPLPRSNDQSLVLSVRLAGRRILLNGDIAQQAITGLLATGMDLRADLTDLPHHGAFVRSSPLWLQTVAPRWVIQSNGYARLHKDRWEPTLSAQKVQRWSTAIWGMITVRISNKGQVSIHGYRPQSPPSTGFFSDLEPPPLEVSPEPPEP